MKDMKIGSMEINPIKVLVYTALFLGLWYALLNNYLGAGLTITLSAVTYHIHHSTIGIVLIVAALFSDSVTKSKYSWLDEVLLALGGSLLIHHILTEGLWVFLT